MAGPSRRVTWVPIGGVTFVHRIEFAGDGGLSARRKRNQRLGVVVVCVADIGEHFFLYDIVAVGKGLGVSSQLSSSAAGLDGGRQFDDWNCGLDAGRFFQC